MQEQDPAAMSQKLRMMALRFKADQFDVEFGPGEPFGALMEIEVDGSTVSLVAFLDGTASMYISSGGGIIGGGQHIQVSLVAKRFVKSTGMFLEWMTRTETFPWPRKGMIRFYALLLDGVYTCEVPETELKKRRSPLSRLFYEGHNVLTQIRLIDEKRHPQ